MSRLPSVAFLSGFLVVTVSTRMALRGPPPGFGLSKVFPKEVKTAPVLSNESTRGTACCLGVRARSWTPHSTTQGEVR